MSVDLKVALTGGLASGKSTVGRLFESLGTTVIDADKVARELVAPGSPALQSIIERFGAQILHDNGSLDRARLRDLAFADDNSRLDLEAILHPGIRRSMHDKLDALTAPYAISMIPLLFETGQAKTFDRILVVDITVALQKQRAQARDGSTNETLQNIIDAQISRDKRLAQADDIIYNDTTTDALRPQVEALHERYIALASRLRAAQQQ